MYVFLLLRTKKTKESAWLTKSYELIFGLITYMLQAFIIIVIITQPKARFYNICGYLPCNTDLQRRSFPKRSLEESALETEGSVYVYMCASRYLLMKFIHESHGNLWIFRWPYEIWSMCPFYLSFLFLFLNARFICTMMNSYTERKD